jgi:hypothetical protein
MMRARHAMALAAGALLSAGCSYVTSSTNADPSLSGELWYVRTDTFLGFPAGTSVWYCPAPTSEVAQCERAEIAEATSQDEPAAASAPPAKSAETEPDPEPKVLWSAVTREPSGPVACAQVLSLLDEDDACEGDACSAPLALVTVYLRRCGQEDAVSLDAAKALRDKWRKQAPGDEPSDCLRGLLRLARSRSSEMAERYVEACTASRLASNVEKAVLAAASAKSGEPAKGGL